MNKSRIQFWDECVITALKICVADGNSPGSRAKWACEAANTALAARDENIKFLLKRKVGEDVPEDEQE